MGTARILLNAVDKVRHVLSLKAVVKMLIANLAGAAASYPFFALASLDRQREKPARYIDLVRDLYDDGGVGAFYHGFGWRVRARLTRWVVVCGLLLLLWGVVVVLL